MPSQRKPMPTIESDGGKKGLKNQLENAVIEIDATFGRSVGLVEGQKVSVVMEPSCAS